MQSCPSQPDGKSQPASPAAIDMISHLPPRGRSGRGSGKQAEEPMGSPLRRGALSLVLSLLRARILCGWWTLCVYVCLCGWVCGCVWVLGSKFEVSGRAAPILTVEPPSSPYHTVFSPLTT